MRRNQKHLEYVGIIRNIHEWRTKGEPPFARHFYRQIHGLQFPQGAYPIVAASSLVPVKSLRFSGEILSTL